MGQMTNGVSRVSARVMRRPVILVVEDEKGVRETLRVLLKDSYEVITASDGSEAVNLVKARPVDLVLMDLNLPRMDGLTAMDRIREFDPDTGIIMLSAFDSAQQAVSALKKGAYDYITKPFDDDDLLSTIKRYTDTIKLKDEVDFLKDELRSHFGDSQIISRSPKMKKVFDFIKAVSNTSSNVLITGESGTGKELVARGIHTMGNRKDKPFVAVNCGAVPSELMESELFGHEKGAFTGAHTRKTGRFEYADGGTLFLDEVSTLPMHLQIKLLRVLQERSFERVGSNIPIKVDIRVVAATNLDLEKEVREGRFREDLYYRLKVVPIDLPPLRDRREDIPLLTGHFLESHARKCGKPLPGISRDAFRALIQYHWPGNIRELENLLERLVVLSREGVEIGLDDLPLNIFSVEPQRKGEGEAADFREACRAFERHFILTVLNRTNWNRIEAAREMKIHRNTLLLKMKELGIHEPKGVRGRG